MSTFRVFFLYVFILILVSFSPLSLSAAEQDRQESIQIKNPGADLWRAVRQRNEVVTGKTQVKTLKAGILIDTKAYQWREFRYQWLLSYGGYFLLGVFGLLLLLFLLIRKRKIPEGRSGKTVSRMNVMQRVSHWFLVLLVGFMALTGLLLLFGRFAVIPLIGVQAFSPIASASKEGHNLFGSLLVVAIVMMLVYFIRYNFPAKVDFKWLFTLGGLLTKKHLEAGFFNAGEKVLYWAVILLGVILSITGLILLFPIFEETASLTQLVISIHAIAALLLVALALAHIWMVLKVEGTIDAMNTGNVDVNWARAHHSLWYEEVTGKSESSAKEMDLNKKLTINESLTKTDKKGAYE